MSLRVLFIIPTLDRHGAEKQLTMLAGGLPKDRFDAHVCALTRGGPLLQPLRDHQIPTEIIGKSWKVDPWAYWRLRRHIRRLKPDVVHTWIFAANAYGRQAALAEKVAKIAASERCVDPWKRRYELAIDRYLARRTDAITTNSRGVVDFYARQGLPEDKFVVIPNGVTPFDDQNGVERTVLLKELALPSDAKLILAVNRLWPQKRLKDLIWAAELLKVIRDDAHLLIVGDGPQKERLMRYRDLVGLQGRVHFLGPRNDVARLLPHAECLWLGSEYEGQSNAVLEAMSAGLPVIASDIPGNRDLVIPDQTGYLTPLGDRAAFARWTQELLEDPALAQRMGQAGRQRIEREFSVDKMVQGHAEFYEHL